MVSRQSRPRRHLHSGCAMKMKVACDTPHGVEFAFIEAKGKGVLILERIVEKFAEARGWKPGECEPLMISDALTGRQMWAHDRPQEPAVVPQQDELRQALRIKEAQVLAAIALHPSLIGKFEEIAAALASCQVDERPGDQP